MTPRPALALLAAGIGLVAAASLTLAATTLAFLAAPLAISSTSGNLVYKVNGELVAYPPFRVGMEPIFIAMGLALTVAAVVIATLAWRRQPS